MDNEVKTWLKDIEQAILEINSFIPEVKNFKDFQKDVKTKRAVERNTVSGQVDELRFWCLPSSGFRK
jgi:uncharacterized protein with HEPN domain